MSEQVSDERLKELASIQSRAAAVYALEFDEDVLSVIEELIERRACHYEAELRRLSEFVQTRHPSGAVKHIGLMEAVPAAIELISEASEWIGRQLKDDDNEPITAEWLWQSGFYRECDYGGDLGWFAKDFDDGTPDWLTVNPEECEVSIVNDRGDVVTRPIRTRGDLRRLWVALTGKELWS